MLELIVRSKATVFPFEATPPSSSSFPPTTSSSSSWCGSSLLSMSRLDALRQQQSLTPRPQPAGNLSETDDQPSTSPASSLSRQPSHDVGYQQGDLPTLSHRLKHTSSILTIALGEDYIYCWYTGRRDFGVWTGDVREEGGD